MLTVYKYPIAPDTDHLMLPKGSRLLTVQTKPCPDPQPFCWALVDDEQPLVRRPVVIVGTGHEVPKNVSTYIGTFQLVSSIGLLVFHMFELNEENSR
jgi:hypothetical protein